jgi:hypothetical protein
MNTRQLVLSGGKRMASSRWEARPWSPRPAIPPGPGATTTAGTSKWTTTAT